MADAYFRAQILDAQTVAHGGTLTGTRLVSAALVTQRGGVSTSSPLLGRFHRALVALKVTAAAAGATDKLDVYVQKDVGKPGDPQWTDFIHFTQVLGNGGAIIQVAELVNDGTNPTAPMHAIQNQALAVGVNHGPWSDDWRIAWTVTDGGTASFTFEVEASLWA